MILARAYKKIFKFHPIVNKLMHLVLEKCKKIIEIIFQV